MGSDVTVAVILASPDVQALAESADAPLQLLGRTVEEWMGDALVAAEIAPEAIQIRQLSELHLGSGTGYVLLIHGDMPLITGDTIRLVLDSHKESARGLTIASYELANPVGRDRVLRGPDWSVQAVIPHDQCSPEELDLCEVEVGIYVLSCSDFISFGQNLQSRQFSVHELVKYFREKDLPVEAVLLEDSDQFLKVTDRWQVAVISQSLRERILRSHCLAGITIEDPTTTWIDPDVMLGKGVIVRPNSVLCGKSQIGAGSKVGPHVWIKESAIGEGSEVFMSHMIRATIGSGCKCGPFANLRPGTVLGDGAKIGNYVEIKNAVVGEGASISHLSYIGDASVGPRTNVGAGTITCNYNGFEKSRTEIGADCFIGSHSTLVAPVTIGDESLTAAGSVINRDVPSGAMAIGRGKQENKEEWYRTWRKRKMENQE